MVGLVCVYIYVNINYFFVVKVFYIFVLGFNYYFVFVEGKGCLVEYFFYGVFYVLSRVVGYGLQVKVVFVGFRCQFVKIVYVKVVMVW